MIDRAHDGIRQPGMFNPTPLRHRVRIGIRDRKAPVILQQIESRSQMPPEVRIDGRLHREVQNEDKEEQVEGGETEIPRSLNPVGCLRGVTNHKSAASTHGHAGRPANEEISQYQPVTLRSAETRDGILGSTDDRLVHVE